MATSFFFIYVMATSFVYIYVMDTSFFYIFVMATSFFFIYVMATSFFYIYKSTERPVVLLNAILSLHFTVHTIDDSPIALLFSIRRYV